MPGPSVLNSSDYLAIDTALADLVRGGAVTSFQARWLAQHWHEMTEACWYRQPLEDVPEHTRAYLDSLRDPGRWLASKQGALS